MDFTNALQSFFMYQKEIVSHLAILSQTAKVWTEEEAFPAISQKTFGKTGVFLLTTEAFILPPPSGGAFSPEPLPAGS